MTCAGSLEDVVSDWRPAHSLVGEAASGAKIAVAPCLLHTCLSALWEGCKWHLARSLFGFARVRSFGKHNGCHTAALEPSHRTRPFFFFFFFVSLPFPRFGFSPFCAMSHSPLRVSSWYSTLVLSLRSDDAAHASAPSPYLVWADTSV